MSESKLKMADGKGGWIEMEIRPPECPTWEDGRHCFVPTVDSRTALARGGFDGPPTHKACACGAEVGRRK